MDDTPEDGYNSAHNSAKKKGFKNAVDFLQSRGIPLTREDVFLARSSPIKKSPSNAFLSRTPSTSPTRSSASHTPHNRSKNKSYTDNNLPSPSIFREGASPLQEYKAMRAQEDKLRSGASKERVKAQSMLTESMIKRKKKKYDAKYSNRVSATEEKKKQDNRVRRQTIANTPLFRVNMEAEFNTPGSDEYEGSELSAMSFDQLAPRGSNDPEPEPEHRRISSQMRGDNNTVSDVTTTQSQSPLTKVAQASSEYNLQELREDLSRMKLTIQLLKESKMNISSERQLSEEMYQDEIVKLKAALKAATVEIRSDKETMADLSTQLEKLQQTMGEMPSLLSSIENSSQTPLPPRSSNKKSLNRMVSISRCDSIGSTVSADDCADVKIDDIKGTLLRKFGWTEIEQSDTDEKFSRLLAEIEQLKQQNKTLVEILKAENIDVSSVGGTHTSRPVLTRPESHRRLFYQPGSDDAPPSVRRAPEGVVQRPLRQRNIANECSSVSVSSLKDRFLNDNT